MRAVIAAAIVLVVGLLASRLFARGSDSAHAAPADMGKKLRRAILETPPEKIGVHPSKEFPNVYAVLMDWPLGDEQIATVFSACDGAASLYTTSTFGIVGGEAHPSVREAAKAFVRAASPHLAEAVRATEYPYPTEGRLKFYLLTFDGVRVIDADLASVSGGRDTCSSLFAAGQAVLAELRKVTESKQ